MDDKKRLREEDSALPTGEEDAGVKRSKHASNDDSEIDERSVTCASGTVVPEHADMFTQTQTRDQAIQELLNALENDFSGNGDEGPECFECGDGEGCECADGEGCSGDDSWEEVLQV